MNWTSYHVHSNFCHGEGDPEEYIKEAINCGVKSLGFSSHAPLSSDVEWTMRIDDFQYYCKVIKNLRLKYKDKLDIFLGLEADFIPDMLRFDKFRKFGAEYIIGSNHFIGRENGEYKRIESSYAKSLMLSNTKAVVENYYKTICDMVYLEKPDIIAHFDLIKKINIDDIYFSEEEEWYKRIIYNTLKHIAKTKTIIEVNTSNIYESFDWLFPSIWILKECFKLEIPITLSSDAHMPEDIIYGFDETAEALSDIGFKEIMMLDEYGWKPYKLK